MIEVNIKYKCEDCDSLLEEDEVHHTCVECMESKGLEEIKDAINSVKDNDYLWNDKTSYVGFNSDYDLETFLLGVRRGYLDSLFWVCEYFGLSDFFEQLNFKKCDFKINEKK